MPDPDDERTTRWTKVTPPLTARNQGSRKRIKGLARTNTRDLCRDRVRVARNPPDRPFFGDNHQHPRSAPALGSKPWEAECSGNGVQVRLTQYPALASSHLSLKLCATRLLDEGPCQLP